MAPEQAEGRLDLIDTRTDIYGLGSILFEILTGSPPHRGQNINELLYRIASGETPRTRAAEPSVPAALDDICARAMAKDRGDRYARATDLADDVQRWLADEPVSAHREGWSQRLGRWSRRHRAWVQAGAASFAWSSSSRSASRSSRIDPPNASARKRSKRAPRRRKWNGRTLPWWRNREGRTGADESRTGADQNEHRAEGVERGEPFPGGGTGRDEGGADESRTGAD